MGINDMKLSYGGRRLLGSNAFKNGIIAGAALWMVVGVSCAAFAQVSATGTGQAAAGADASAGAQSGSTAAVTQNYYSGGTTRVENAGTTGVTYGGGTNNTTRNIIQGGTQDTYRATIRNTPDVYAPNVSGGTNSCLVGMSGGGSVAGFGIGIGGNWSDPDCERRQLAALAFNTGQQALAQEIICGSTAVREARQRMGQPCLVDVQAAQARAAANQPPVILAGAPAVPGEVIGGGAVPQSRSAVNTVPDWCMTASPQERRRYPQCTGLTGVR